LPSREKVVLDTAFFTTLEQQMGAGGDFAAADVVAKQIGDDTLQRNAGRTVQPHTFTHGTSAQRQRWFARGFESGQLESCDTFSARQL
jgi:predicted metalloprotease